MSEWISAHKKPHANKMVLVWYEPTDNGRGYPGMAFYDDAEGIWLKGYGNRANDIFAMLTHWQPLPAPPEPRGDA